MGKELGNPNKELGNEFWRSVLGVQRRGVEITREKLSARLSDRIRSAADIDNESIFSEFSAAASNVVRVVVHRIRGSPVRELSADRSRGIIPKFLKKLQDTFISLGQPLRVLSHTRIHSPDRHSEVANAHYSTYTAHEQCNYRLSSLVGKQLCSRGITTKTGSTACHAGARTTRATDELISSETRDDVRGIGPQRLPSTKVTQAMSKSDHHEQNATDSPEETTNNCPICSTPIQGIGCAGPAAQTVEPCGCDLTAIDATVDDVIPGADQATETIVDSVDGDGDLSLLSRGSIDAWLSSDTTVEDVEVPER